MKKYFKHSQCIALLYAVSFCTFAAEENQSQRLFDGIILEEKPENIVAQIPADMLTHNERFFTISSENDVFASNNDRDYTNGIRFTYFDVGKDQPQFIKLIDQAVPFFEINKTTTTYYSLGHNIYTPHDITISEHIENDRPYAGFLYGSVGIATLTDNHVDNVELTLGMVGPSALGKQVQTEYHKLIDVKKPRGWAHQLKDEPGLMLSWERTYPGFYNAQIGDSIHARLNPHYGMTVGNIYTYANAGLSFDITPQNMQWQSQPVRVRPAIPGSGFFATPSSGHSWMLFGGIDSRWVLRNIFLDGNTFKNSYSVHKKPFVFDAAIGAAYTFKNFRITYTLNWRSKEFDSKLASDSRFASISLNYRF